MSLLIASLLHAAVAAEVPAPVPVRRVVPVFPLGADGLTAPVRCRGTVLVSPDGATEVQDVEGCEGALRALTEGALGGWRWAAHGTPEGVAATVVVRFLGPDVVDDVAHDGALDVTAAVALRGVRPAFPSAGAWDGLDVTCEAWVRVDADGHAREATATGCPEGFARKAEVAARRWTFAPTADGTERWTRIPFLFQAHDTPSEATDAPPVPPTPTPAVTLVGGPPPELPVQARALDSGTLTCEVDVVLAGSGRPRELAVRGCPEVLHDAVREAVRRWVWVRSTPAAPRLSGFATSVRVSFRIP